MELLIQNGADVDAKDEFSSSLRIALQEDVDSGRGMYVCSVINIVVSVSACRVDDPGSIPGRSGVIFFSPSSPFLHFSCLYEGQRILLCS